MPQHPAVLTRPSVGRPQRRGDLTQLTRYLVEKVRIDLDMRCHAHPPLPTRPSTTCLTRSGPRITDWHAVGFPVEMAVPAQALATTDPHHEDQWPGTRAG